MSRSGSRYRDPFNIDARRRKGAPHEPKKRKKRKQIEDITQDELDFEMEQFYRDDPYDRDDEYFHTGFPGDQ